MQGGFYGGPSNVNDAPVGAGYFDTAGNDIDESVPNVGFDATAGYHTYGVQWTPGVGINGYVDGKLVWSVTQSQVPGGIVAQAYEIILNLQVAARRGRRLAHHHDPHVARWLHGRRRGAGVLVVRASVAPSD